MVTSRPGLELLGARRAPDLHRTLPTWARECRGDATVEWRIYAPCRGAAVFVHVRLPMTTSRRQAAAALRDARAMLWGRDKARGAAPVEPPADPAETYDLLALFPDGSSTPAPLVLPPIQAGLF